MNLFKRLKTKASSAIVNEEFNKNILTLMSGSVIAQAIPILVSPLLTRIYSPEQYGTLAIYTSIVTIASIFVTGQYHHAVVLPKAEKKAADLMALTSFLITLFGLILFLVTILFPEQLYSYFENEAIHPWLKFVPLSIMLVGIIETYDFYATRKKKFTLMASNKVIQAVLTPGIKLSTGYWGITPNGLIAGTIGGQLVSLGFLKWKLLPGLLRYFKKTRLRNLLIVSKEYSEFPKVTMVQSLLDAARSSGLLFVISSFFNLTILGFYSFAHRMVRMPLDIIGSSVRSVFYQKANERFVNKEPLWPDSKQLLFKLSLLSVLAGVVLIFFGPDLFSLIFGAKWRVAGEYARTLSPWGLAHFIGVPIYSVPMILKKQRPFFFIGLGYTVLIFGLFILAYYWVADFDRLLLILSLGGCAYQVGVIAWVVRLIKKHDNSLTAKR